MRPEKNNELEAIVSKAFENYSSTPSEKVIKNIRFRLGLAEFLRPSLNKFNIYYLGAFTAGILFLTTNIDTSDDNAVPIEIITADNDEKIINKPSEISKPELNIPQFNQNQVETTPISNPTVSAAFSLSANSGCAPFKVRFKNKSVNSNNISWNLGDGTTSSLSEFNHTFITPGTYLVKLSATDKTGNSVKTEQKISVFEPPVANMAIDIETSNQETKTVVFKNISSNGVRFLWCFGDSNKYEGTSAIHTYDKYGTYKVKLIAYSETGCSDTSLFVNRFIEQDYRLVFPLNFRPDITGTANNGFYEKSQNNAFVFYPENKGVLKYQLKISAPNGMEIFTTENIKQGWNGYIGGRIAPTGNYFYTAKGTYPNNKPFEIKGVVKVIVEDYNNMY